MYLDCEECGCRICSCTEDLEDKVNFPDDIYDIERGFCNNCGLQHVDCCCDLEDLLEEESLFGIAESRQDDLIEED